MKLTELILELHTIMLEKGNLDVWLYTEGMVDDPQPYIEPGGVYLN